MRVVAPRYGFASVGASHLTVPRGRVTRRTLRAVLRAVDLVVLVVSSPAISMVPFVLAVFSAPPVTAQSQAGSGQIVAKGAHPSDPAKKSLSVSRSTRGSRRAPRLRRPARLPTQRPRTPSRRVAPSLGPRTSMKRNARSADPRRQLARVTSPSERGSAQAQTHSAPRSVRLTRNRTPHPGPT
jgi:hypothetical protein